MSHDCVQRVNAQLAPYNTKLLEVISFSSGPAEERIALATQKADDKVRKKPALFFASFCPLCGVELNKATGEQP